MAASLLMLMRSATVKALILKQEIYAIIQRFIFSLYQAMSGIYPARSGVSSSWTVKQWPCPGIEEQRPCHQFVRHPGRGRPTPPRCCYQWPTHACSSTPWHAMQPPAPCSRQVALQAIWICPEPHLSALLEMSEG